MKIRDDLSINAYYKKTGENEYTVYLSAIEAGKPIIEITMPAWTESMAEDMCENWKKKNQSLYQHIIRELM